MAVFRRCRARCETTPSTAGIQEAEVGVTWTAPGGSIPGDGPQATHGHGPTWEGGRRGGREGGEDAMHLRLGSKAGGHRIEDGTDILGAVAVRHRAHHRAGGDIEGRQQGGGAVALVVMRAGGPLPRHRWPGHPGATEGLDPGLVIDREDDSRVGRVGGQPHPIMDPSLSSCIRAEAGVVRDPHDDGPFGVLTPGGFRPWRRRMAWTVERAMPPIAAARAPPRSETGGPGDCGGAGVAPWRGR